MSEKVPFSLSGRNHQNDLKPPKCSFCGRELILYEKKWICGHGCTKPAVGSDEWEERAK